MKSALITGITGMVGSHLADYLLKNTDWKIFGLTRWRSDRSNLEHLFDVINEGERLILLEGDLNDFGSVVNVVKTSVPDYVFHLAAQSFPKASFFLPAQTYDTNITGTSNLLEAIRGIEIDPWIHVCSSSEVFGRVSADKLPINEECSFHPASPYAISKIGTDLIGRFHAEAYGQKILTTRMFTHTGPRRGDVFAESSFAKQIALVEAGYTSEAVVKVGNLNSLRTFQDVRDAVRAYFMLLTESPVAGEYYNIGGSAIHSVGEMLDTLLGFSPVGSTIEVRVDPQRLRPVDADLQVPDVSKFKRAYNWEPKISFDTTMKDLLDYWREKIEHSSGGFIR